MSSPAAPCFPPQSVASLGARRELENAFVQQAIQSVRGNAQLSKPLDVLDRTGSNPPLQAVLTAATVIESSMPNVEYVPELAAVEPRDEPLNRGGPPVARAVDALLITFDASDMSPTRAGGAVSSSASNSVPVSSQPIPTRAQAFLDSLKSSHAVLDYALRFACENTRTYPQWIRHLLRESVLKLKGLLRIQSLYAIQTVRHLGDELAVVVEIVCREYRIPTSWANYPPFDVFQSTRDELVLASLDHYPFNSLKLALEFLVAEVVSRANGLLQSQAADVMDTNVNYDRNLALLRWRHRLLVGFFRADVPHS